MDKPSRRVDGPREAKARRARQDEKLIAALRLGSAADVISSLLIVRGPGEATAT
jgi:hypothetical protein